MLVLFQALSAKYNQIKRAITSGDDELVDSLDRELEPLVRAILEHPASSPLEMYMQFQFVGNLIRREADDKSCVMRNLSALSGLLERYFAGVGDFAADVLITGAVSKPDRVESTLAHAHTLNDAILDSLPDRIAVVTRDYRYIYSNIANAEYLNTRPIELLGRHMMDFIGKDRFERRAKANLDACFSGESRDYTYQSEQDDYATTRRCRITPVRIAGGEIIGAMLMLQDIVAPARVVAA